MDLTKAMAISASGMKVQNVRMRIIAENLANQDSVANRPGEDPYRRKSLTFSNVLVDCDMHLPILKSTGFGQVDKLYFKPW